ncbi:MAG TPA: methyltransferase domain-containing protein [Nitrospirae bacterium]|nr:methyltransferase domain-containing protein [Nitrospirota bacterium]
MNFYLDLIINAYKEKKRLKELKKDFESALIQYAENHKVRKLQIGTGPNKLTGWFNTDILPTNEGIYHLDASKPFSIKDESFDYIFSEHQIEHLTYNEALDMLKECYRILKPKGKMRIITPDIEIIISLKIPDKTDIQKEYIKWHIENFFPEIAANRDIFVINNAFSGFGHRFLYDFSTLKEILSKAGFINIVRMTYGHSNDDNLKGIDWRASDKMTSFTGLCVEAEKK